MLKHLSLSIGTLASQIDPDPIAGPEAESTSQDNAIELPGLTVTLKDTKGTEKLETLLLSGVPEGFLIYAGDTAADASQASMANNAGMVSGTNTWEIPLNAAGEVPAYIAILPPRFWSGKLDGLKLMVESGEESLPDKKVEIFDLPTVTVTPVANGLTMNITSSFGVEGAKIPLNLNAAMRDPVAVNAGTAEALVKDESVETTTLIFTGMGEHAAFYAGEDGNLTAGQVAYSAADGGTYTLTGLSQTDLNNLSFVQAKNALGSVTVQGQTVEGDSVSDLTAPVSVPLSITAQLATAGADELLWTGSAINGRGGDDTIQLRFGESLDGGDLATKLSNIEVIDLSTSGENKIENLSIEDVLAMTDGDNILKIFGDNEDSVTLEGDWEACVVNGATTTYMHIDELGAVLATLEVQGANSIIID